MKLTQVLEILSAHREELQSMGVASLDIFGSVARDEANADSDVDCLAEFVRPFGIFKLMKVQHYLEDALKCNVDLGTKEMLKEYSRDRILAEIVHVF